MLSPKQYFLLNLSKFLVELVGTAVTGIFYLSIGQSQAGVLLGFWIIYLFGVAISGAHFHPGITLVTMLRKNSSFGSRRLRGIIYIVAQFLGGILAAAFSWFLMKNAYGSNMAVSPTIRADDEKDGIFTYHYHNFSSSISELAGTAYFVFLIMICTDKKT
jgi:glycerol uptake facilitator-like aquaporin